MSEVDLNDINVAAVETATRPFRNALDHRNTIVEGSARSSRQLMDHAALARVATALASEPLGIYWKIAEANSAIRNEHLGSLLRRSRPWGGTSSTGRKRGPRE